MRSTSQPLWESSDAPLWEAPLNLSTYHTICQFVKHHILIHTDTNFEVWAAGNNGYDMTRLTNNDNDDHLEDVGDLDAMMVVYVGRWLLGSGRNCPHQKHVSPSHSPTFFSFGFVSTIFTELPQFWMLGNCAGAPETGIFLTLCHIFGSLRHNLSLCPAQQLIHRLQHRARLLSKTRI